MTYPHPDVRAELSGWLERRADVVAEPELAATFGVAALPTALLMDGDGRVLDRIVGFLEPGEFLERLEAADPSR